MAKAKMNETQTIQGKAFSVGGRVFANQNSDYRHLFGTVKAFVRGEDCGNTPGAIYLACDFDQPESIEMREELAERFSGLHGRVMDLSDINLDAVILAADMLEPVDVTRREPETADKYLYTLSFQKENESGISFGCIGISANKGLLIGLMEKDVRQYEAVLADVETDESPEKLYFSYEAPSKFCFIEYELLCTPVFTHAKERERAA